MTKKVGLAEAIENLREQLMQAVVATAGKPILFRIDQINIELAVTTERATQGGGGVNFWVVEADGRHEFSAAQTHRIAVVLTPQIKGGPVLTGEDEIPD
jgi:hypothetical protein